MIQKRFREESQAFGEEGVAWSFPGHYQHVRVFYVYVLEPMVVSPLFAQAVEKAMAGFQDRWIGEFECYEEPGGLTGRMSIIIYLHEVFVFQDGDLARQLAAALGGESFKRRTRSWWRFWL